MSMKESEITEVHKMEKSIKMMLIGALCQDVEFRNDGSDRVAQLSLIINESYTTKSGENAERRYRVDVEARGKLAEKCVNKAKRGVTVMVAGQMQLDNWTRNEEGGEMSGLKCLAELVEFGRKSELEAKARKWTQQQQVGNG